MPYPRSPPQPARSIRGDAPAVDSARMQQGRVAADSFLIFLFLLAWIDRVNVGFAKLQMLQDLRFSEAVYGLGAGIFFIGYFLFEGAEQSAAAAHRRAQDPGAHHHPVGANVDGRGLRHDAVLVLSAALPAGRVRGGLLSMLPDVLDPPAGAAASAGS